MPLIWAGMLLLVLRGCEIGPMGSLSWGWVLAPFACALVWFEVIEPMLGLDRKPDVGRELEDARRKRIAERLPQFRARPRGARKPPSGTAPGTD